MRAGLSPNAISALERGTRRRPQPHTVRSLADALGLAEEGRAALLAAVPKRGEAASSAAEEVSLPSSAVSAMPHPATPLVGRERETEEVRGLLAQPDMRLLMLTGIGGVGKTRLAVEAAREAAPLFPDGAAFVGLAPLTDPSLVVPTILPSLGVAQAQGRTAREVLIEHLRDKKLLLVLDNLEHLLQAAPEVAALIDACPQLVVMVTSRAPLRLRGEREYPVSPLALPTSTRSVSEEEVLASPSGKLFAERARASSPGFMITQENASSVAAICWRLAGLPLALELAAAKVRFLDPATLLSRLDKALSSAWARDLPERQRTMKATLDWSYDLLSEPQRNLFRRLSIFVGGFALEAAEAVGAAGSGEVEDVLHLLGTLVEQSLVVAEPGSSGYEARYGMLEPVRQYALEKLEESGEAEEVQRRHAEYFLALAETAEPQLRGPRQAGLLEKLEQENDNLRAAMGWALDPEGGDLEIAARMGRALWFFWWYRGHQREGGQWIEEVLLRRDLSLALRAKALVVASSLTYSHGDYAKSAKYAEEGLELSRQVGDELHAAHAQAALGVSAMSRTDYEAATSHLEEALRSYHEIDEDFGVSQVTSFLGMIALMRGDESKATSMFEEGLAVARRIEDRTSAYVALYNLALVALARSDHDRAAALFEEGITLSEQVGDRANLAYCLEGLATVAGAQGREEHSACLFGAAEGLLEEVGARVYNYYVPDPSLRERAEAEAHAGLGNAAFEEARERGRAMTFEQAVKYALGVDASGGDPASR